MAVLTITDTDTAPTFGSGVLTITDSATGQTATVDNSPVIVQEAGVGLQGPASPAENVILHTREGGLSPVTGTVPFQFPFDAVLIAHSAAVVTPPVGSDVVYDVKVNGVSIFASPANRGRIIAGSNKATETAVNVHVVAGDWLTVDIVSVGSTTPGANLTTYVRYQKEQ